MRPAIRRSPSPCCASVAARRALTGLWNGIVMQADSGQRRFLALVFPFLAADLCHLQERAMRPETPTGASPSRGYPFEIEEGRAPAQAGIRGGGGGRLRPGFLPAQKHRV